MTAGILEIKKKKNGRICFAIGINDWYLSLIVL